MAWLRSKGIFDYLFAEKFSIGILIAFNRWTDPNVRATTPKAMFERVVIGRTKTRYRVNSLNNNLHFARTQYCRHVAGNRIRGVRTPTYVTTTALKRRFRFELKIM